MSTERIDGTFTDTKPFSEAFEEFMGLVDKGQARSFHVGTEEEIEKIKGKVALQGQIDELAFRVGSLEPVKSDFILIPTDSQIEHYCKKFKGAFKK